MFSHGIVMLVPRQRLKLRAGFGFRQNDQVCCSELTREHGGRSGVGSAGVKGVRVDERHDAIQGSARNVGHGLCDSHGVCNATGFDHHCLRGFLPRADFFEAFAQVGLERAARTAVLEFDGLCVARSNDGGIDIDRRHIVDDGGDAQRRRYLNKRGCLPYEWTGNPR